MYVEKESCCQSPFYNLLYVAVPVCFDQTFVEFTAWFQ